MCWACGSAYRVLRERRDGKKPLGKPSGRYDYYDNVKMGV